VPLGAGDGMPQNCVVNLDTITTIPKDFLQNRMATLSSGKLVEVEATIHFALGMEDK